MEIKDVINTIIKWDCIENLKKLPDECVDLIFADPPYFMQTEWELLRTDGSKFNWVDDERDKFSWYNEYDNFCYQWLGECKRIMKKNASIWVIWSFQNIYRIWFIMQNLWFWILNDVIRDKPNAAPNFSWTRLQNSHETLLWCTKSEKAKYTFNYKTMKHLNGWRQERSVRNIWICIWSERLKDKNWVKVHSTQKPEALLFKIITASSKPWDIVLDPFFWTGTTWAIAKRTWRNYIWLEREIIYIKAAEDRLRNIKVEHNEINDLELEVKPPKVPMELLIKAWYLSVWDKLCDRAWKEIWEVNEKWYVNDWEDVLSIHKMSAKHLWLTNNNWWDYFRVLKNWKLISIDSLRYKYIEENK